MYETLGPTNPFLAAVKLCGVIIVSIKWRQNWPPTDFGNITRIKMLVFLSEEQFVIKPLTIIKYIQ